MGAGCGTKAVPAAAATAVSVVFLFTAAVMAAFDAGPAHAAGPYAQADYPGLGVRVQTVADGLAVPWSIDWLPDGTAIFTERGGTVSVIRDGLPGPEAVLSVAAGGGAEAGLLGVTVDPDFEDNGYVYLYYTYADLLSPSYNRIERYTYHDGSDGGDGGATTTTTTGSPRLGDAHIILDRIPASPWHDGGRIQFGPDGMLYAATGDAIVPELSQDASSLAGKILRMDRDGRAPADNPWEGSLVYSMGHRNPQGMDWDRDGRMIITEHGPSGRLGVGHDEINVVAKGGNYGWPVVIGDGPGSGGTPYENPAFHTGGSTWAPSGAEFYESDVIPEWQGRYFVATLLGRTLQMVQLGPGGAIVSHTPLFEGEFGRLRDVQTGPDGHLYVLTSNRDGRGAPILEDDRILRIEPLYEAARGGSGGAAPERQQQLRVLTYDGPETADTGPLVAALRHPGYEVSSLTFDIGQKSLDFGFARSGTGSGHGHADSSLSLYVQRPLVSAPFEVVVYDESGDMVPVSEASGHAGYPGGGDDDDNNNDNGAADPAAAYAVRHGPDHYVITVGTGLESGRVAIIGEHVVPEYPSAILVMAAAAVAVVATIVLAAAAPQSLARGAQRAARSAGVRPGYGPPAAAPASPMASPK